MFIKDYIITDVFVADKIVALKLIILYSVFCGKWNDNKNFAFK